MSNRQGVWSLASQYQAIADINWTMAPGAPTGVSGVAVSQSAIISFTAPTFAGIPATITGFKVTSSEGETATGSASPITVSSLTNGTAYTFTVQAQNAVGLGKFSDASSSLTPRATRGLFGGGMRSGGNPTEVIQYYQINSGGQNALDFGDLPNTTNANNMAVSSSTRAVFIGGTNGGSTHNDKMNYVTIASTGNSTEFGQLSERTNDQGSGRGALDGTGCGNETRGVMARGAHRGSGETEDIIYITIASAGGDTDFGDLSDRVQYAGSLASPTRGIILRNTGNIQTEYVTIASTGNATNFGLIGVSAGGGAAGASSNTRGLMLPGNSVDIRYCTIATTGAFADFGDLTQYAANTGFTSDGITAVRSGAYVGAPTNSQVNTMDQTVIATLGNSTDFGDLLAATLGGASCSDSHGGL